MERVAVVGSAGSGKTTLSAAVAQRLDLPHLELDSIHHQPDWTPLPEAQFRTQVAAFTAKERWIVDGNYSTVADLVWSRADTVVFLDLDRRRIFVRLLWRTIKRGALRQELWNGNRERLTSLVRADPERNIVRWSWTHHRELQERFVEQSQRFPHLDTHRLRTPVAVRTWLSMIDESRSQ